MRNVPVAKPAPVRTFRLSRGPLLVGAALAAIALVAVMIASFAWPNDGDVRTLVGAGDVDDFAVNEPVHFQEDGFFVVKLATGEVIALSDQAWGHLNGPIEWQPDLDFVDRTGWFRSPGHNETYSLDGSLVFGPGHRGMDRFPVEIVDGRVRVDTAALVCATDAPAGTVCVR